MYQVSKKRASMQHTHTAKAYSAEMAPKSSTAGRALDAAQARAFVLAVLRLNTDRRISVFQIEQVGEGLTGYRIRKALQALVAEGLAEVLPVDYSFSVNAFRGYRPTKYYRAVPPADPGAGTPSAG